jgi:hypothetical protein
MEEALLTGRLRCAGPQLSSPFYETALNGCPHWALNASIPMGTLPSDCLIVLLGVRYADGQSAGRDRTLIIRQRNNK